MNNDELTKYFKHNKPDASEKTIHNYIQNIKLLNYNMTKNKSFDKEIFDAFPINELTDCINRNAEGKSKAYLRNMLCSLKAYSGDKSLTKLISANSIAEQEDSKNPEGNEYIKSHHLTQEVIDAKYDELKAVADNLWDRTDLEMSDFQKLQQYVMYCFVCGKFMAPRRTSDWIKMKIRNIDLDKDNYIDKKSFVFNAFKTIKDKGVQTIDIPPELYRILRKWIRFNKFEHLFVDSKLNPLSPVSYAQKLNNIMGVKSGNVGGYSTNCFRHSYLTNKYSNTLDLEKDMNDMGSSLGVAHVYIKKV